MQNISRPPLWGNFVSYADEDLLAFGLLMQSDLGAIAFYHAIQSVEKYLKSLVLAIIDPEGYQETSITQSWLKTHNLVKLAKFCSEKYSYYGQLNVQDNLRRFIEFDQVARYPWVDRKLGNGFSGDDISIIDEICCRLRNDLPIEKDNYKLGMEVRGYFHGDKSKVHPSSNYYSHEAVKALRKTLPSIERYVRGWDDGR